MATSLIPIIIILTAFFIITLIYKRRGQTHILLWLISTVIIWTLFNICLDIYQFKDQANLYLAINQFCEVSSATLYLYLILKYTNRASWITPTILILFTAEPILFQTIYWSRTLNNTGLLANADLLKINYLYILCILVMGLTFLLDALIHKSKRLFSPKAPMAIGALFPFAGYIVSAFFQLIVLESYIIQMSYLILIIIYFFSEVNSNPVETFPITRESIVEEMDDGWMIIDTKDRIIDTNSSAEKILGVSHNDAYGKSLKQVINEWPSDIKFDESIGELELRIGTAKQNRWKYLNVRYSELKQKNKPFGHLIFWRDVTRRKLEENARQSDRDELYLLLNALSGMASSSVKLNDFLSEAAYQLIYTFNSQSIAFYLKEETDNIYGDQLQLELSFGFQFEDHIIKSDKFIVELNKWLKSNKDNRPAVFDKNYQVIGENILWSLGSKYYIFVPLVVYTQNNPLTLGCILLARDNLNQFSSDEILRFTTITNQISSLIESNRRRQFAIVSSERQRLLRDLHDSVSQKLYGLVALTEAAQAAIEVGSDISPSDILTRIGDSARQAVKEMRLFLYQMQPIDLKDGIVSSLHHRLAAVEGRADLKARLLSDDNIQVSKDVEIALYFIAQEALNNILRHGQAKNVTVTLKKKRQNIVLEIIDDGVGFDLKHLDESGLGIKNMKERAEQLNGKFKITSQKSHGTKITVSINKKERL